MKFQEYKEISARTENQLDYFKSILNCPITVVSGPSGTGKTLGAFYIGYKMLRSGKYPIEKILYCRSNTDFDGEKELGALPGDKDEKMMFLVQPALDNLKKFLNFHDAEALVRSGKIEFSPVAMLRGRDFENTLMILDEAQNTSAKGVKAFLTRMNKSSKAVVIGDTSQKDTPNWMTNGLADVMQKLDPLTYDYHVRQGLPIPEEDVVQLHYFHRSDIQRHPVLRLVLERYEGVEHP